MRQSAARVVCLLAILPLAPADADQSVGAPARSGQPAVRRSQQDSKRSPLTPSDTGWRYRFHNGHWWYWREDGSWAYWTGSQWYRYAPQSYRRWRLDWKLARNEAAVARLKTMLRSQRAGSSGRGRVYDPDSFLPFANERGSY